MQVLKAARDGQHEPHILPFLWIHGEGEAVLRNRIQTIYDSGIRSLCVEARPHDDFNGAKWFSDLDAILQECKRLGMQMWLLDDSHFPTGYANGAVKQKYPHLRKKYLRLKTYDFVGPIQNSGAVLKYALTSSEDEILGVFLQRRTGFERIDVQQTIDVTNTLHTVKDYNTGRPNADLMGNPLPGVQTPVPVVRFDLPEGAWSLNILTVSYKGGEKQTEGYLNPLVPEATDILLNTVYQPVYDHFAEEFGKTFRGFFSDEPRLGNIHGAEDASIGRNSAMNLPWRDDMLNLLAEHCRKSGGAMKNMTKDVLLPLLPLLFIGDGDTAHALRFVYMDLVSRMYSEHFDGRIANWCHAHHCEHIGHCIEDNEASSRLGYGAGHLFRAMAHADMAGIDVVIHQLMPGEDKGLFKGMHSPGWDGEFFTYLLGKFGGSMAHLDPVKRGRCMCELFGAYGWAEGNRLAKWLADYMMVRGVNVMVPHAFNCKAFPDSDCPPHFYADGHNPQYPEFKLLMQYCERICTLMSDGTACPDVAVYFNAEGEWSGEYLPTQKVAAVLAKAGIDYDLVSSDYLVNAQAEEGRLLINGVSMGALVMPWAEALPMTLLTDVLRLARAGVPVWFVNSLPKRCAQGGGEALLNQLAACPAVRTVSLEEISGAVYDAGLVEAVPDRIHPYLRRARYHHSDGDVWFFTNESPDSRISTRLTPDNAAGYTYVYDPFENTVTENNNAFQLDLPPCGSCVILVTKEPVRDALPEAKEKELERSIPLKNCDVSLSRMENMSQWRECLSMDAPGYITSLPSLETFSGWIRYDFQVSLPTVPDTAELELDGVREAATVRVNGVECGTRICQDYRFHLQGLQKGENRIEVELNTTLGRSMNDFLSSFLPLEPAGMTGAVLKIMKGKDDLQ